MNNVNSPYSTQGTSAAPTLHMDVSQQAKIHQSEDAQQKAPKILPHVGEVSLVETVGGMYMKLMEVNKILNKIEKEPKRDKEAIKQARGIVEEIGKKIMELYEPVDKLYL